MNTYLAADVPDPTDFPDNSNAPGLRTLDSSLRCTICGELFDGPVTLPCGHCFCSVCVRTSMSDKQECPACRKAANEGHLRSNPAMEEVVAAWKLARPYILQLVKDDKSRRTSQASVMATPGNKKRKLSPASRSRDITSNSSVACSSTTPNTPSKPVNGKQRRTDLDDIFEGTIPTSDADEDEMHTGTNLNPQPDDIIQCPLCTKAVKYKSINVHIDKGCPEPPSAAPRSSKMEWNKIMAPRSNKGKEKDGGDKDDNFPLPKASYGTLKDKKLKEMLAEQCLPTTGERNVLIKRHQQWIMIYNANLDKSISLRRPISALRKDLKKWEDDRSKQKKATVEDVIVHEKRHKNEFAQLIDIARMNKNTKAGTGPLLAESDSNGSTPLSTAQRVKPPSVQHQSSCENVIVLDSEEELEIEL